MGAAARIGKDVALIGADEFTARCRTSPGAFTRRRKMPAGLLVESVIARKGRTLKIELREFARERGMGSPISAPGYSKAREKLNPGALLYLAQRHAANVYADGDFETYKGMLLVAIDGSTATVPTTPETLERYGDASARGKSQATMGLSGAFDVINRQMLNVTVNRGGFDERAQVPAHLEAIPSVVGDLAFALLLDRGEGRGDGVARLRGGFRRGAPRAVGARIALRRTAPGRVVLVRDHEGGEPVRLALQRGARALREDRCLAVVAAQQVERAVFLLQRFGHLHLEIHGHTCRSMRAPSSETYSRLDS